MARFTKADAKTRRGPGGRKKGSKNRFTLEVLDWARQLFKTDAYLANLARRMMEGRANHMETYLHHRVTGPDKAVVALERPSTGIDRLVAGMPRDERSEYYALVNRLRAIRANIVDVPRELAATTDAEIVTPETPPV